MRQEYLDTARLLGSEMDMHCRITYFNNRSSAGFSKYSPYDH